MWVMSVLRDVGKIARVTSRGTRGMARGVRATANGTKRASRWVGRNVGSARQRGGAGNVGMMRLLDLHAISCAGDTLFFPAQTRGEWRIDETLRKVFVVFAARAKLDLGKAK